MNSKLLDILIFTLRRFASERTDKATLGGHVQWKAQFVAVQQDPWGATKKELPENEGKSQRNKSQGKRMLWVRGWSTVSNTLKGLKDTEKVKVWVIILITANLQKTQLNLCLFDKQEGWTYFYIKLPFFIL